MDQWRTQQNAQLRSLWGDGRGNNSYSRRQAKLNYLQTNEERRFVLNVEFRGCECPTMAKMIDNNRDGKNLEKTG